MAERRTLNKVREMVPGRGIPVEDDYGSSNTEEDETHQTIEQMEAEIRTRLRRIAQGKTTPIDNRNTEEEETHQNIEPKTLKNLANIRIKSQMKPVIDEQCQAKINKNIKNREIQATSRYEQYRPT